MSRDEVAADGGEEELVVVPGTYCCVVFKWAVVHRLLTDSCALVVPYFKLSPGSSQRGGNICIDD